MKLLGETRHFCILLYIAECMTVIMMYLNLPSCIVRLFHYILELSICISFIVKFWHWCSLHSRTIYVHFFNCIIFWHWCILWVLFWRKSRLFCYDLEHFMCMSWYHILILMLSWGHFLWYTRIFYYILEHFIWAFIWWCYILTYYVPFL